MKLRSKEFIVIFFFLCNVYMFLSYIIYSAWTSPNARRSVNLAYVVVHIDLKGAPPKLEYLHRLLPMMKDNGVNAILMEYEDMFPYQGRLVNLSAEYCYSPEQLRNFLSAAHLLDIEIIPLLQTFGHMEFVLKLKEFQHLRENLIYPDSICPSKIESMHLIREMLEQVLNFHNNITHVKHIHVGCDEVYEMNKCDKCLNRATPNEDIYIDHIHHISTFIKKLSPDTIMLIWDDMLRQMKPMTWSKIDCFNNIELVYWSYGKKIDINYVSLNYYHKKFKNIWAASAFKGAESSTAIVPDLYNRLSNHLEWMQVLQDIKMAGEKKHFDFKGIILTGWSRFSHMQPLCELLPTSIQSLIQNLGLINTYKSQAIPKEIGLYEFLKKYPIADDNNYLTCEINLRNMYLDENCDFEGVALYRELVYAMHVINQTFSFLRNSVALRSANGFYSKSNYVFLHSLQENVEACKNALNKISDVEKKVPLWMEPYYDNYVIDEYIGYNFYDIKQEIMKTINVLNKYVNKRLVNNERIWGRRDRNMYH